MIQTSLSLPHLAQYTSSQINSLFNDGNSVSTDLIQKYLPLTLSRLEHSFSHLALTHFFDGKTCKFNHLHGDQYGMYLYMLSNTLYKANEDVSLCAKLFALNKLLHGVDAFYEVQLPDIFLWIHPLGTVLGRGAYADFFVVYQRCGIGSNKNIYPTVGRYCTMHPGSSILGNSLLGDYCELATNALVLDEHIPACTLYIGTPKQARYIHRDTPNSCWRR